MHNFFKELVNDVYQEIHLIYLHYKRDKDLISFILIKRIINKIATEIYIKNSELE